MPDALRAAAQALGVRVVEYDNLIVEGEPQVAFDSRAEIDRRGKCAQAVLGNAAAAMQPAMRVSLGTRVERVSGGPRRRHRSPPPRPVEAPARRPRSGHGARPRRTRPASAPTRRWRPWAGR